MSRTHEDTADDYPYISCRAVGRTHDGAENGAETGYIEELDDEYLPGGHRLVVDAVFHGHCRRRTLRICSEISFHELSVKEIACQKKQDTGYEGYHFVLFLYRPGL